MSRCEALEAGADTPCDEWPTEFVAKGGDTLEVYNLCAGCADAKWTLDELLPELTNRVKEANP